MVVLVPLAVYAMLVVTAGLVAHGVCWVLLAAYARLPVLPEGRVKHHPDAAEPWLEVHWTWRPWARLVVDAGELRLHALGALRPIDADALTGIRIEERDQRYQLWAELRRGAAVPLGPKLRSSDTASAIRVALGAALRLRTPSRDTGLRCEAGGAMRYIRPLAGREAACTTSPSPLPPESPSPR